MSKLSVKNSLLAAGGVKAKNWARCHYLDIRSLPPGGNIPPADMPAERARVLRSLMREEDKSRCLAGWLLLRRFLGRAAYSLRQGLYGKPFLPGGPYFNLSHSGHYAVLALSSAPVGVDVEKNQTDFDWPAVAAQSLHPEEQAFLRARGELRAFFDLWTLKESYLKMRGRGLAENPAEFAIDMTDLKPRLAARDDVNFGLYHILPGHSVAICLHGARPPAKLIPAGRDNISNSGIEYE